MSDPDSDTRAKRGQLAALSLGVGLVFSTLALSLLRAPLANSDTLKGYDRSQGQSYWLGESSFQSRAEKTTTTTVAASSLSFPLDVYLLMDLTASFGGELATLEAAASTIIVPTLLAWNPDIRFGLGTFQDYPITPYGAPGDLPYVRVVDLTFDTSAFQAGISGLTAQGGGDTPESQLPALYEAATGTGHCMLTSPGYCVPSGQQANFREGAIKLFLLLTDTSFHQDYPSPVPSYIQTVLAIQELGSSVVMGISSGGGGLLDLAKIATDTDALAPATGVDCDLSGTVDILAGDPLVCTIGDQGQGISEAVVALVKTAAEFRTHDLTIHKSVTAPFVDSGTTAVVGPGETITYTLTFSNAGKSTATGVSIVDRMPTNLTVQQVVSSGVLVSDTGASPAYVWEVQDLIPDAGGVITITCQISPSVSGEFDLLNRTIITTTGDVVPEDNSSTVSITVDAEPPGVPVLLNPANQTVTTTTALALEWEGSTDAAGYLLDLSGVISDVGKVTVLNTGILTSGVYTWTIAAYDALGNASAYAAVWSFTVERETKVYLPLVVRDE